MQNLLFVLVFWRREALVVREIFQELYAAVEDCTKLRPHKCSNLLRLFTINQDQSIYAWYPKEPVFEWMENGDSQAFLISKGYHQLVYHSNSQPFRNNGCLGYQDGELSSSSLRWGSSSSSHGTTCATTEFIGDGGGVCHQLWMEWVLGPL